jgi:glycerol-3-phosphate dehydrogenase (NAD(P)+)
MKAVMIGCGRWGSFIAWYLDSIGNDVTLYGRPGSKHMEDLLKNRENDEIKLPPSIILSQDLSCVDQADTILISINSQGLRKLLEELKKYDLKDKIFILCMKGIEVETGNRLSQIVMSVMDSSNSIAVWLGPGHVQEFYNGIPNCMVIDSYDEKTKRYLVDQFSSDVIRFYLGEDMIGNEVGAAAKNVIGIAAGMLDGLHLSSLKGALMARGTKEVSRLIKAMGGNELSAYGLCHLGDYEATLFSKYSHNRQFGEQFVAGLPYEKLAEGYYTVKALMLLKEMYQVELPICEVVYRILYEQQDPQNELNLLFRRRIRSEIG